MVIYIINKLRKVCNEKKATIRKLGPDMAGTLHLRITQLEAFECLADVPHNRPFRRHELSGDRKGQISVDLIHPYRLFFIPAHSPIPRKPDGGLDLTQITEIEIVDIDDPH